jgi:tRNA nucleotidyltransferase/poly(A) polymerase
MLIDRDKIKPDIFKIASKLSMAGYKSYLVGGAIRDIIFGGEPEDYDILTDARCEDIGRIFKNVIPYGMKHGTVLVVINKSPYDLTSYNDGEPAPLSLENDLAIRDFTINAMACDLTDLKLIDLFDGLASYGKKEIKCVLSPEARFTKDPLRILRAVRQAAKFNFDIERSTFEAAQKLSPLLINTAPERIMSELVKLFDIINNDGPKYLRYLVEIKAWHEIFHKYYKNVILPEADKSYFNFGDKFYQNFSRLNSAGHEIKLAYLIIFSLCRAAGDKIIKYEYRKLIKALFELKFCRDDFDKISALVFLTLRLLSDCPLNQIPGGGDIEIAIKELIINNYESTKLKTDIREVFLLAELFSDAGQNPGMAAKYRAAGAAADKILTEKHPLYIEDLKINGNDVKALLEACAGDKIGRALKFARREIILDKNKNTKEILEAIILKQFKAC